MAYRQPYNGAGQSQNDRNAVRSAIQANLQKSLGLPIDELQTKLNTWDRVERSANSKFARREKLVDQHLVKISTPKPSLSLLGGVEYEGEVESESRSPSPERRSLSPEISASSPNYLYDDDPEEEMFINDDEDQDYHDNGNSDSNEEELYMPSTSNYNIGVCDNANNSAVFDMTEFKKAIGKFHKCNQVLEQREAFDTEEKVIDQRKKFHGPKFELINLNDHKNLPDCPQWIPRDKIENPFVAAILASNHEQFFKLYVDRMPEDGTCSAECLCQLELMPKKRFRNPLHLAAVVSNVEFLKYIASDTQEMKDARKRIILKFLENRSRNISGTKSVDHYERTKSTWETERSCERMAPIELAAELGRFTEFKALFGGSTHEYVYNNQDRNADKETPIYHHNPSMLSRLVHQKNFMDLYHENPNFVKDFLTVYIDDHKKRYAASSAARIGDMETLKILEELMPDVEVFKQRDYYSQTDNSLVVPGKVLKDGTHLPNPVLRPPVAHELAEHGHFDAFDSLEIEQKLVTDFYSCTALVSMLQFSDEQVKSQLKLFGKAEREDLFLFIAQIIMKNRRGLLKDALKLALMNPDNFDLQRKGNSVYQDYGLPDYVPLPMETALSRTGDMTLVEMIADLYQNFIDKHRRKMIEEDALRCVKSIQDRACRCSEQVRLAVICMMLPFAPPSSKSFKKTMRMYLDRGETDNVSKYVLENHSVSWKKFKFEKWNVVFENAGREVKKWNGSVETEQILNNINPQVKTGIGKNIPFFPNRKTPGEKRKENAEKPKSIDHIMSGLVKAFREMPNCD